MDERGSTPLFVALECDAPAERPWPRVIGWARGDEALGEARTDHVSDAAERLRRLADGGSIFVADYLFDAAALRALFAEASGEPGPPVRDWMLALAPFGQARHLAAIHAVVRERCPKRDGAGPAARHMLEVWREARQRSGRGS